MPHNRSPRMLARDVRRLEPGPYRDHRLEWTCRRCGPQSRRVGDLPGATMQDVISGLRCGCGEGAIGMELVWDRGRLVL